MEKFSLFFILLFLVFAKIYSIDDNTSNIFESSQIISEFTQYLIRNGNKNAKIVSKKSFKEFLNQLYASQEIEIPRDQIQIYQMLIIKLTKDIPESFPISDLPLYLSGAEVDRKINEAFEDLYGKSTYRMNHNRIEIDPLKIYQNDL